jgi:RNA polymerase sigma factor (TIGR02999 family)
MNQDITGLLLAWRQGDEGALNRLFGLVYDELRRTARRQLGPGRPDRTLDTTGVVHEAYLRLVDRSRVSWESRAHFLAVAARVMRHIVIDDARRRRAAKRGGKLQRTDLDETAIAASQRTSALAALDDALNRLAVIDERLMRVVECRYFAGLSEEETAEALGVSTRTVRREWLKARGWLVNVLDA